MTTLAAVATADAIQERLNEGRIPRYGPVLMLLARSTLILLAQGLTYLLFVQLQVPRAGVAIRNWWSVYGTLVDIGCLALLVWLTKREGIRLLDLVGLVRGKLKTDIALGLGIFATVFPITVFGGGALAMLIAYGTLQPEFPEGTYMKVLPLLGVLYSRLLWWPIWSATEEMTYNGYALPRLIALTKSRWLSVGIVSFFFSIQHSFLALATFRQGLYMFITFVPLTIALELIYLRIRRLPPLIVAHWLMDLSNVVLLLRAG
jgi:hypothetical protein